MSRQNLENLTRIRKLQHQAPAKAEFDGLLASGERRLKDAQRRELSIESQFDLAYNAAHALDLDKAIWRILDQAHRSRNLAEYEGHLDVEQSLVGATIRVANKVLDRVKGLAPLG